MTKLQVTFEAALEPVSFGGFRLIGIKATIHVETNEENRMKAEECVEQTKEKSRSTCSARWSVNGSYDRNRHKERC